MDNKPFSGRLLILVFAVAACFPSPVVWSAAPEVTFDIPFTIECRDVTPKGFRETHPSEKIIEAKFRVSMRITKGIEKDIKDLVYVIDSPERRLNVSDFIPRTKLGSEVAGTISIVETAENSLGGALAVKYEAAEATGQASQKKTRTESYTKLPPKELVLASGTVNREHGVFFKLRPSSDDSLEGMKEFACLFAVPKEWRGDWVVVSCVASVYDRGVISTSEREGGIAEAYLGLHVENDVEAARLSRNLGDAQEKHAKELKKELRRDKDAFYARMMSYAKSAVGVNDLLNSYWMFLKGGTVDAPLLVAEPILTMAWKLIHDNHKEGPSESLTNAVKALKDATDKLAALAGNR